MMDEMGNGKSEDREETRKPIFRDIRRYYCLYCGICRSKKSLIRAHLLFHHEVKLKDTEGDKINSEIESGKKVLYACEECGASFRKPAYLKQHMQGHSLEVYKFFGDYFGFQTPWIMREALDPILRTPKC